MEQNPLLGFRAIYNDIKNVKILKAEFKAVKILLDEGYHNRGVKIPFVRDVSEYIPARNIMKKAGIIPYRDFEVGVSIETPSAALPLMNL